MLALSFVFKRLCGLAFLLGLINVLTMHVHAAEVISVSSLGQRMRFPPTTITVTDPLYQASKEYQGYWLKDVLAQFDTMLSDRSSGSSLVIFRCRDGYAPMLDLRKAISRAGFVALRNTVEGDGWDPIQDHGITVSPSPAYVIWADLRNGDSEYPWPYQVESIELIGRRQLLSFVFPSAVRPYQRGFTLFEEHCLKCHTLNLIGGTKGPELNVPLNITEYWNRDKLLQFIKNPSSVRSHSSMPIIPGLSDSDVIEIVRYLSKMRKHRQSR